MEITNAYRSLGKAITLQALKDFIDAENKPKTQQTIIKHLKSAYMDFISEGISVILANMLENKPEEVNKIKKLLEEREKEEL